MTTDVFQEAPWMLRLHGVLHKTCWKLEKVPIANVLVYRATCNLHGVCFPIPKTCPKSLLHKKRRRSVRGTVGVTFWACVVACGKHSTTQAGVTTAVACRDDFSFFPGVLSKSKT